MMNIKERVGRVLPSNLYLKFLFRKYMGQELDLHNPLTFSEKLQWLKLYDHNPLYIKLVDKESAKQYVAEKAGDKYIIPTIGVWDNFESIDFDKFPNQFSIKTTHDSGSTVICKKKSRFDRERAKEILNSSIQNNYYIKGREWPYKYVNHRIIAEKYMCDNSCVELDKQELTDYKFYCFNGYVDCVMVCYDRTSGDTKFYFFDKNWQLKRINKRGREAPPDFSLPKPVCLEEMFDIASILSQGIPFVRVDLYQSNEQVYFGEMTFYPQSGFDPNYLPETDKYFGNLIDLKLAYKYRRGEKA